MKVLQHFFNWMYAALKTERFFWVIVGLFTLSALWIALSAIYPMPFDEYYHVGIIQVYADQWSPFIASQASDQSYLGDITRLNSYFYHYLMSFPYRIVDWLGGDFTAQLLVLRTISVTLAAAALVQFRRLLLESGFSKRLTHSTLAVFILIPIIPFVSAHINYDNLLVLITVLALRLSLKIILRPQNSLSSLTWLVAIGFLGCIVKETFIPLLGLMALAVVFRLITFHKLKILIWLKKSAAKFKRVQIITLSLCLIVFGGQFLERYIGNLAQYGTLTPKCEDIHSEESCSQYSVWLRNYRNLQTVDRKTDWLNLPDYGELWLKRVMKGNFVIFSHFPQAATAEEPFGPIQGDDIAPVIQALGWTFLIGGSAAFIYWYRRLWQSLAFKFLIFVSVGYVISIFIFNYQSYLTLGAPQAIQARYFYPVLPILITLFLQALSFAIKRVKLKTVLVAVTLILALQGGAAISYIIFTNPDWYLPNSIMTKSNEAVRNSIKAFIIK